MAVLLTLTAAMVAEGWDEAAEGSTFHGCNKGVLLIQSLALVAMARTFWIIQSAKTEEEK
jgi:hypothetical protein